ncbi:MAG: ribosome maturation factor RimM [Microbacter sp.]
MIPSDQLKVVGQIVRQHGIHGEMLIVFSRDLKTINPSFFFVEMEGIFVPFFIHQMMMKKNRSALLQFDEINSAESCHPFIGKNVYLPSAALPSEEADTEDLMDDLIGYTVVDQHKKRIGTILDMDDTTQNILFIVQADEKEIYIPANESFIDDIDDNLKIIYVDLPEGLLDVNG